MKKINDNAEMRVFNLVTEFRAADTEGESRTVIGSAAVFNVTADLRWYKEMIAPEAFDEVLADPNHEVVALFNHDNNLVLGRRSSGTLKVYKEGNSLKYEFEAPNTTAGNDLLVMLKRGDIKHSSFQFEVSEQKWTYDDTNENNDLRTILKVKKLWDVSPVTFPAYQETDVAKRSRPERNEKPVFDQSALNARIRTLEIESKF
jgi:HK97 family phage prohead protease